MAEYLESRGQSSIDPVRDKIHMILEKRIAMGAGFQFPMNDFPYHRGPLIPANMRGPYDRSHLRGGARKKKRRVIKRKKRIVKRRKYHY